MSMDGRQKDAENRLKRSARVQVRVLPDAAEVIAETARRERRTIAEMVRVILEEWAEQHRARK